MENISVESLDAERVKKNLVEFSSLLFEAKSKFHRVKIVLSDHEKSARRVKSVFG